MPITTTGGTTVETSMLTITSTVPTTSTTTTTASAGMGSPSPFLPNGSPSRPTVTATCRPQTWVQRILEGWTGVPPPDDTELEESDLHEPPSSVEEEVLENLCCEWRVLHPFKLPGVRHPTDTTPANQRRLAENDALVEPIQTTEYLEDIPMWGQRDYQLYPPRYGDPFYRGRGRGRGRGRREMMSERPHEKDSTQGFGRGSTQGSFGRGNGRGFYSQGPLERNEMYSEVEEWSDPASEGRRRSDVHIYAPTAHSRHPRTPPTPDPLEDRLFTDWSSIGSRSPPLVPPMHSVPTEGNPITPGVGDIHEAEQATSQPSIENSYRYHRSCGPRRSSSFSKCF